MIELEFDELNLQPADEKGQCKKEILRIEDENVSILLRYPICSR
jgi:hypothetical protein